MCAFKMRTHFGALAISPIITYVCQCKDRTMSLRVGDMSLSMHTDGKREDRKFIGDVKRLEARNVKEKNLRDKQLINKNRIPRAPNERNEEPAQTAPPPAAVPAPMPVLSMPSVVPDDNDDDVDDLFPSSSDDEAQDDWDRVRERYMDSPSPTQPERNPLLQKNYAELKQKDKANKEARNAKLKAWNDGIRSKNKDNDPVVRLTKDEEKAERQKERKEASGDLHFPDAATIEDELKELEELSV